MICNQFVDYNEQGSNRVIRIFEITSTASFGTVGSINYSERQLQAMVSKCRGLDAIPAYQCS